MRGSSLIKKEVFTTKAKKFSVVDDLFIEIGHGGGQVIGLRPEKRKKVIPYNRVAAIGDIILVSPEE